MDKNTGTGRAGWAMLIAIAIIAIVILALFFLEYLVIGFFILAILLVLLAFAAIIVVSVMIIPMYALKGTVVEEGSYSIDEIKAVDNDKIE